MEQILGFSIVILIGLSIWGLSLYLAKRRREAIEQFARQHGFDFDPGPYDVREITRVDFSIFNRGRAQKVINCVRAIINNRQLILFDYRYTTGAGKQKKTHHLTVVHTVIDPTLPEFTLAQETVFSKIAQSVGYQDIDFVEDPTFSKLFALHGEREEAIRACFDSSIRAFLSKYSRFTLESKQGEILWCSTRSQPVEQWYGLLAQVELLARTFAKH